MKAFRRLIAKLHFDDYFYHISVFGLSKTLWTLDTQQYFSEALSRIS